VPCGGRRTTGALTKRLRCRIHRDRELSRSPPVSSAPVRHFRSTQTQAADIGALSYCGRDRDDRRKGTRLAVCRYPLDSHRPPGGSARSIQLTGRPFFPRRTVVRSAVYPPAATSSTRMATTSQPRSLLSIAKLNMARRVCDLRSGVSSVSTKRVWVAEVALPPSVSLCSMALAELHSLDPAWPYFSARLQSRQV
jgi:hypothetical protein